MKKLLFNAILLVILVSLSTSCSTGTGIKQSGDVVKLGNDNISLEFDLSSGTYNVIDLKKGIIIVREAALKMNELLSTDEGYEKSFTERNVSDEFGNGLVLELSFKSESKPDYQFSFTLYQDYDFISVSSVLINDTGNEFQLKDIYPLSDAKLYEGSQFDENFAMMDGFSGGEPLEYGRRMYSPLSREYALKSRNNILLTIGKGEERNTLIMGGLTYQDFERNASIEQARKVELQKGADGENSLLAYLDLPGETGDETSGGPALELVSEVTKRTWDNNEFRCIETATSAVSEGKIIVKAGNLDPAKKYYLGWSWWRGMRHGNRKDHKQSVYIEYSENGKIRIKHLIEDELLPRFDARMKEDVKQVEIPIPSEAIASGEFNVIVEKTPDNYDNSANDPNAYLSELWLRDGSFEPLLPPVLTDINKCERPRREVIGNLYASDPVGKRIDPGESYDCPDRFYFDFTTRDPLLALEKYGQNVKKAQDIELSMYDFPSVCLWYAEVSEYGGGTAENSTLGAVNEMKIIKDKGFLKYSRAAVRLVPDSYLPDNQQGWWDDEHWQMEEIDRNDSHNGQYVEPYETSEKWGKAVTELGGIPLTYFQAGFRSEDYAKAYPGHMLFNNAITWRGGKPDTTSELFTSWNKTWTRNRAVWGYDYTDPDFLAHLEDVYENLASGGIKGLMFDYPGYAWSYAGGFEDKYASAAEAYRNIFRMPYEGLGPGSYVHERNMERGTDISIGYVASMRTENDTDRMDETTVTRCGLRWYKNRVIYNQDTDSKNIARLQGNRDDVRAVLTMAYVTTGRLLLANSFDEFTDDTYWDITRTFPYHTENRSARPADAFVSDVPMVYDFAIDDSWHQVTFFNPDASNKKIVGINISGEPVDGALAMDPTESYHVYDFWNDNYIGIISGSDRIEQELRPGEARMLSVRKVLDHPQVISTDRHIMQGFLDMTDVKWTEGKKELSGVCKVVGEDPYVVTLAANGMEVQEVVVENSDVDVEWEEKAKNIFKVILSSNRNEDVRWTVKFQ